MTKTTTTTTKKIGKSSKKDHAGREKKNKLLVVGFMLMMKPNITSEQGQKNNDLTRAKMENFRHWKIIVLKKLFKFLKH